MIARLLLANGLEFLVGVGVAAVCDQPLGVAYLAGLAVVGIASAHLALIGITYGWFALSLSAVVSMLVAVRREGGNARLRGLCPRRPSLWGVGGFGVLAGICARAWPTFAAKPLNDYDGWAEWGLKAKALTVLGWADPHLFAARLAIPNLNLDYPLLLPSLEAVAARAMGGFDSRLIHLQFLLLAVAAIAAIHAVLRDHVPGWLLWPTLITLAVAPAVSTQLLTADADVPLAFFVAAGVVAAAHWLDDQRLGTLAIATLFFAAAVLTKKEGELFVAAAYLALALTTRQWRPLIVSALAVEACLLPWQLWVELHHVHGVAPFSWTFIDYPGNGPLILHAVLAAALSPHDWLLLLPIFCVALVATAARSRVSRFAGIWALASYLGIATTYLTLSKKWTLYFAFTGYRVVDSLVVGAAALTPLLATAAVTGRSAQIDALRASNQEEPDP